ncbi:hypothetical protein BN1723_009498 [Verticillium longisporum]|uniref:Uncharacterized protein n=1 Tax=Verticillium longisporum TaxID=100787 RepID=A0A0G4KPW2_VERLO|nr:hypothetical protein BN1723_009498 [Verticillium longisporum]
MRLPSIALAFFIATTVPSVQADDGGLVFTGPDPDSPLNLSSNAIRISWTIDRARSIGNWQHWRSFDLHYITLTSGGTKVDYTIRRNVSIPDGDSSFTWDPSSILEGLNDSGNGNLWLEDGEEHYFESQIKNMGRWGATTVPSEKYAVEGYDRIGSLAAELNSSFVKMAVGLTISGAWVALF